MSSRDQFVYLNAALLLHPDSSTLDDTLENLTNCGDKVLANRQYAPLNAAGPSFRSPFGY